jgi:hypothetical protein
MSNEDPSAFKGTTGTERAPEEPRGCLEAVKGCKGFVEPLLSVWIDLDDPGALCELRTWTTFGRLVVKKVKGSVLLVVPLLGGAAELPVKRRSA